MNKGLALILLLEIDQIFKDKGVDMFLLFGTALGAYRERQFIDGDDDIDLGSFELDKRDDIANTMREKGFEVSDCHDEWVGWRESEMIHAWKDNIHVDIFFFVKQGDEWIANRAVEEEPFVKLPPNTKKEFEDVVLHNHTFKVLSPIERYLEFCYTDWKKPSQEHGKLYHDLKGEKFEYTLL